MADEFSDRIIEREFTCVIGHLTHKRNIAADMSSDIDMASKMGVVVASGLIFLEKSLLSSLVEEMRKHEHKKVEDHLILAGEVKIKEIEGEDPLQHVMQKVVVLILGKARADGHLRTLVADEAHDVAGDQLLTFNRKDVVIPYPIVCLADVIRKHQQPGIIGITQFCNGWLG